MKNVFEEVVWYCFGNANVNHGVKHGTPKECKNITALQNYLSSYIKSLNLDHEMKVKYISLAIENSNMKRGRLK